MSATAVETLPIMLASAGVDAEGRRARITLDGPGGARLRGRPGPGARRTVAADREPDVTLELDVVDVLPRRWPIGWPPTGSPTAPTGDADLARAIVDSLPALAVL